MLYFLPEMMLTREVNWRWVSGHDGTDSVSIFDGTVGKDERTRDSNWKLHFLDHFLSGWTAIRSAILFLPVNPFKC